MSYVDCTHAKTFEAYRAGNSVIVMAFGKHPRSNWPTQWSVVNDQICPPDYYFECKSGATGNNAKFVSCTYATCEEIPDNRTTLDIVNCDGTVRATVDIITVNVLPACPSPTDSLLKTPRSGRRQKSTKALRKTKKTKTKKTKTKTKTKTKKTKRRETTQRTKTTRAKTSPRRGR